MNDLTATAEAWGIDSGYQDVFGRWHAASPQTLGRLIEALSAGAASPPHLECPPLPAHPMRCWQGDGRRLWALSVQLYAVRSHRNWGHGDFTDLARLIEIAGASGASAIGLNPLHALFPDRPSHASPYAPNSRLYLNPLYVDVEAIPEFPGVAAAGLTGELAKLRAGDLIEYDGVAKAKLHGLQLAYEQFAKSAAKDRRADFDAYRAEAGETLLRFACFEVLRQVNAPKAWRDWPQPLRSPGRADLEAFRRAHLSACEFQEFIQWVADRQLRACLDTARKCGMPIGLYTDLAVGIDPSGADAWSRQDAVVSAVSIGAPPDEFNRAGQDWGLAPFNPLTLSQDDFAPLRQLMRAAMRHAGAIRLDHVMGLERVFMIPHGMSAGDGAYVHYPLEPLLRVIGEESCRHRCIVIGEDLGTVPEGFREQINDWGIWSYLVMMFERDDSGAFRGIDHYAANALVTFNTHDLATYAGWRSFSDLKLKRSLGIDPGESDEARWRALGMLDEVLRQNGIARHDLYSVATFLSRTRSRLLTVSLEDLLGLVDQPNIPGTVDEHPNWRRRLPVSVEHIASAIDVEALKIATRERSSA